ncbi:MAG TPA: hypothetical protein VF077_01055 [Nitrospiraceae bacterium]
MGDQVVLLMQGSTILKTMLCRDKTLQSIQDDVRIRWSALLVKDVQLVVANVMHIESVYASFQSSSLNLNGLTVVKE